MHSDIAVYVEHYNNASNATKAIVDSDRIPIFVEGLLEKHGLPAEMKRELVMIIADTFLDITNVTDIPDKLGELFSVSAELISSVSLEIRNFIETERANAQEAFSEVTESAAAGAQAQPGEQGVPVPQPLTPQEHEQPAPPQEPEGAVQPLRTMEEDMDKIHGYGAYRKMHPDGGAPEAGGQRPDEPAEQGDDDEYVRSTPQDEVLKERPSLADTPSYNEPPPPPENNTQQ